MPVSDSVFLSFFLLGWVDDSIFIRRSNQDDELSSSAGAGGSFTTGRQASRGGAAAAASKAQGPPVGQPPPVKPRSQVSLKLEMSVFKNEHTQPYTVSPFIAISSRTITGVKQCEARLVLGWDTVSEHCC